jgi:hypothetical protein
MKVTKLPRTPGLTLTYATSRLRSAKTTCTRMRWPSATSWALSQPTCDPRILLALLVWAPSPLVSSGKTNPVQECGCEADLASLGYHITYFDLDTSDYLNDSPTLIQNSKTLFDNALVGKSPTTDDFLVIAHDIHNQTSAVLVEYMLKSIAAKGYRPVTVGTCLGDDKSNWYRTDTSSTLGSKI